ncbi:MFS multidrug-resistance DHA1 sub-family [Suillus tomentosus]|nr:MFS multidrug-resistance DHA1 sub-family [Suillus tomentosus]
MIAQQNDEETHLLQRPEQPTAKTPLPWDQFWILLLLEMPDFLSSGTLAPFIPQLIRDIGVTHGDETKVGHYAGILQSSYYAAHTLTIFHWSQLSDHIGRRPVILTALSAIVISMLSFGLSKTFLGLVVSRIVCGAFDPSDSMVKSMLMDITDATNMPKAYSYIPIPLMIGTSIGPRQPSSNVIVDPGEGSPGEVQPKPLPLRALLTSKVLSVTASYTTMGLFQTGYNSVLPVFYATPIELGGLSLDPPRIGALLAVSGVIHGIFQLLFYAHLHDRFGAKAIFITGVSSGIPIVILFPVANALARAYGIGMAVWLCVVVQLTLKTSLVLCFPCMALSIRAAAPNRASLGTTNGIVMVVVAVARIIGPASAASVFSYSLQEGHDAWLIYYFFIAITFLAEAGL